MLDFLPVQRVCLALLCLICLSDAGAQDGTAPASVKVADARRHGELPYRRYIESQKYLLSRLPPEPRLIDFLMRTRYQDMSAAEQDAYLPQGWGVAVVSDSVDATVPLRRGGYFLLPELAAPYEEDGVILFREPNKHWMVPAWSLRVGAGQRIGYTDLGRALAQVRDFQGRISFFLPQFKPVKRAHIDAVKACFLDDGGIILVGGKPADTTAAGMCRILAIDPARVAGNDAVEFSGRLDIVTFIDSRGAAP